MENYPPKLEVKYEDAKHENCRKLHVRDPSTNTSMTVTLSPPNFQYPIKIPNTEQLRLQYSPHTPIKTQHKDQYGIVTVTEVDMNEYYLQTAINYFKSHLPPVLC